MLLKHSEITILNFVQSYRLNNLLNDRYLNAGHWVEYDKQYKVEYWLTKEEDIP